MDPNVLLTNGAGEPASIDLASTQVTSKAPPLGEQGSAYDPERIFTRFDDGKYFETRDLWPTDFETMLKLDGKARTLEHVLCLPLMSAEYSIEPGDGDSGEAEFVRNALERPANAGGMSTPLDLVIGQMTSAVVKKRSYFEKVFKAQDGRVLYDKIAFRPQGGCYLLRDKKTYAFRGFKQKFMADGSIEEAIIMPQKAFVYIHGQYRDPLYGVSALDTAYNLFQSKQKVRFLWYSFLENQVLPKAIAHHATADPTEQTDFAKKVATLKSGGVVGVGPEQDVTAFSTAGNGGTEFKAAMDYLSAEQSNSVLAGFTDLTSAAASGRGSFALSESAIGFFQMVEQAVLTEMGAGLTSWTCADLVRWNFGINGVVPNFRFKPPPSEVIEQAFSLLQSLATTTQPARVPQEFIDLLTEKVAGLLGINADQVRSAIEKRQEQAPQTPDGKLQAGIAAAHQLVSAAGMASGSQPSPAAA